jgi:hypothetical protein
VKTLTVQSQEYGDNVEEFKQMFKTYLNTFKENVNHMALGGVVFADSWKDWLGIGGVTVGLSAIDAMLTILAGLGILAVATTAGVGVAIIAVGFVATAGFAFYRYNKKLEGYRSTREVFGRDDVEQQVLNLSEFLANTYAESLHNCTKKDAHKLAHVCMNKISKALLKNKVHSLEELTQLEWPSRLAKKIVKHPQQKIKPLPKMKQAVSGSEQKTSVANSSIFHHEEKFSSTKPQLTTCQKLSM